MNLPPSLKSAVKALDVAESRYARLWRKLDRIAHADACKGDLFIGWDWPTLRICRPDDYAALRRFIRDAQVAAGAVRFFSFIPRDYSL